MMIEGPLRAESGPFTELGPSLGSLMTNAVGSGGIFDGGEAALDIIATDGEFELRGIALLAGHGEEGGFGVGRGQGRKKRTANGKRNRSYETRERQGRQVRINRS